MSANHKAPLSDFYSTKTEFDEFGFAGPFPLDNKELAIQLMNEYPDFCDRPYGRHRDVVAVRNVLMDTSLRNKLYELCSNDLFLWRTNFFMKVPGSQEIGWHHDKHFQSAEVDEIDFTEISSHFSVCMALEDMTDSNGSLEVILGSHVDLPDYTRDKRPYYSRPVDDHFTDAIPDRYLEKRRLVQIRTGEFLVFHSALMHRSLPYESGPPRVSFVSRYIDKKVSIPEPLRSKLSVMEFSAGSEK